MRCCSYFPAALEVWLRMGCAQLMFLGGLAGSWGSENGTNWVAQPDTNLLAPSI